MSCSAGSSTVPLIARGEAPKLRWVHAHGAGINHLLPLDWLPRRAVLTNSRGIHAEKADEYTIMALLMLNNRLAESFSNQRRARWEQLFSSSIVGKTVLIVGVGHIGAGAAKWAKRFGLRVIGIRRSGRRHVHVDEMHQPPALRELLPRADFVLITAPHTDETTHLIGARELGLMKDGAGLVNYSRANLVDYDALRPELSSGRLSAILDVFDPEPLPDSSPLWNTPNLVIDAALLVGRRRTLYAQDARPGVPECGAAAGRQAAGEPGEPAQAILTGGEARRSRCHAT